MFDQSAHGNKAQKSFAHFSSRALAIIFVFRRLASYAVILSVNRITNLGNNSPVCYPNYQICRNCNFPHSSKTEDNCQNEPKILREQVNGNPTGEHLAGGRRPCGWTLSGQLGGRRAIGRGEGEGWVVATWAEARRMVVARVKLGWSRREWSRRGWTGAQDATPRKRPPETRWPEVLVVPATGIEPATH